MEEPNKEEALDYKPLVRRLTSGVAGSVLCIGISGENLFPPDAVITTWPLEPSLARCLADAGRFEFALVAGLPGPLDHRESLHLLAQLRDLHTHRIALISDIEPATLLSLGFTLGPRVRVGNADGLLAMFDLAVYKTTPDWFNANHWAHPERWDRDWW